MKKDSLRFLDAHVNSDEATTNKISSNTLVVGSHSTASSYTYVKFTLPSEIKESDRVLSAQLALHPNSSNSYSVFTGTISDKPVLAAYETSANWSDSGFTWNTKPAYGDVMIDYDKVDTASRWYTWDITKVLHGNGFGDGYYGVTLKEYKDEASGKRAYFYSSNYSTASAHPFMQVTYLNMIGLEDYWTYHSQSAGLAGTGYVNDFTGNLTAVFEDFTVDSERLPMSVYHVYTGYNSGIYQSSLDVGSGFRLNIQETVVKKTIAGETKYLYTDGDGTEHYFEKNSSNEWVDDSGLDLKLTVGTSEFTITDKKDNKRIFYVSTGYLKSITDNDGNRLTLNYNGSNQLTSISDDTNRTITFNRISGTNRLGSMTYNGRTISYEYSGFTDTYDTDTCLTKVTFPGGSTINSASSASGSSVARFHYTDSGTLTDMIDETQGIGIHYGYLWQNQTRRVNTYSVSTYSGTTPTLKNRYAIEYKQDHNIYSETATTSPYAGTGRWEMYYFNNMGQTISAQDQDGNALYSEQGMSGGAKNKVTFASKTQKTITNLLKNHSFENGTTNYSTYGSSSNVTVMTGNSTHSSLYGSKLLRITGSGTESGMTQSISVKGGQTYTLSAYVETTSSAKAVLELSSSYSSAGTARDATIQQKNGYKRYDVTLDLSNASSSSNYTLTAKLGGVNSGYVLFDAIQLEAGECANRYNMIENGSFESAFASTDWNYTNQNSGNASGLYDGRAGGTDATHSGSSGILFRGSPTHLKNVYQTIPVSGSAGEGFVFGAWIKSNAIPNKDTDKNDSKQAVAMTLEFLSSSGSSLQKETILLTPTPNEWTYACGEAIAKNAFSSVKVYLKCNYNANISYFDDVQVYKDTFGESFVYDDKGNVQSVTDMAQNTQNATTNGNNDLTTYKDGKGYSYTFVYDDGSTTKKSHNLTKTTAPDGTYTSMAYYSNGLLQYVSVYNSTGSTAIRTSKTYGTGNHYLATSVDQLQKTTTYNYDSNSGLLNSVSEPYGNGSHITTTYGYNIPAERLVSLVKDSLTVNYTYSKNRMSSIGISGNSQTTKYNLNYSTLGNLTSIDRSANNGSAVTLESYSYNEARGLQTSVVYRTGDRLDYTYDNQDRLVGVSEGSTPISKLIYNSNGLLGKAYSYDGTTTWNKYQYDFAERYVGTQSSEGFGTYDISYDKNDNNTGYTSTLNGLAYNTTYGYNNVNNLTTMSLRTDSSTGTEFARELNSYDNAGRLSATRNYSNLTAENDGVWTAYSYLDPTNGQNTTANSTHTTNLVSEMRIRYSSTSDSGANPDYKYNYTYDDAGNISTAKTTLKSGTAYTANFTYDARGQLTKVYDLNNNNRYYIYSYDKRGNILSSSYGTSSTGSSPTNQNTYTYNSSIPDELSSVTMKKDSTTTTRTYTYDTIGNPTKIVDTTGSSSVTKNLDWKQGKQLASVSLPAGTKYFYYDESGRVKKTVLGSTTVKYHYDSDNLEYEEHYEGTTLRYVIKYFYDSQDRVQFALYKDRQFSNSGYYNLYTYIYNGFGEITDIVKLRDGYATSAPAVSGTQVAHYEYDPYGAITKATTYDSDPFAAVNPIRYKAYYYDTDLSWYNLGARYYDPSVGRFLNCDNIGVINNNAGDILNKNLYAYCNNSPIMYYDDGGDVPILVPVVLFLAGGGANLLLDYISTTSDGTEYTFEMGALAFASGGISTLPYGTLPALGIDFVSNAALKKKAALECVIDLSLGIGGGKVSSKIVSSTISNNNAIYKQTDVIVAEQTVDFLTGAGINSGYSMVNSAMSALRNVKIQLKFDSIKLFADPPKSRGSFADIIRADAKRFLGR